VRLLELSPLESVKESNRAFRGESPAVPTIYFKVATAPQITGAKRISSTPILTGAFGGSSSIIPSRFAPDHLSGFATYSVMSGTAYRGCSP